MEEIWKNEDKDDIEIVFTDNKCDKYDYLIAVGCGAIGGLVDIFLVGMPMNSKLCNFTDKQVDEVVMAFARRHGWKPRAGNENNVASAIGKLREIYKVNYDQTSSDVVKMYTKDHHMKSLAHSPDILGLFFSIVNQFTGTATFFLMVT